MTAYVVSGVTSSGLTLNSVIKTVPNYPAPGHNRSRIVADLRN
jgi:hypothetical protein